MRKNLYLSGLFLCILALCICGCGSGGGSVADPMGTATVRFIDEAGSIITTTTVGVNGTITLRAWVTNTRTDGTVVPVVNEKVSFVIVAGIGSSLVASSDHTGSDGQVTALFTSGNNTYSDQVRVTTSTGATASIYINKTGGSTTPFIKTLEATNKEVVAGQTSVITANVVDGGGNPVGGVPITFTIPVNTSGAVFSNNTVSYSTYTDIGGNATVVYQAGENFATSDVFDTVQAELPGFSSSKAVEIKRTAGAAPLPPIVLAAEPTSLPAGQTSVITATLGGKNKAGAPVSFSIPVNTSGAAFINSGGFAVNTITVTAGSSGIATVIYRAGTAAPGTTVQDTVQGLLADGSSAVVILTRTSAQPSIYTVSITATSTTVKAGEVSIITAHVTTTDTDGTAKDAAGVVVEFSLPVDSSGATLSAVAVMTDGNGNAVVIYRPGNTQVSVQDTVQAAVGTAVNAIAITVTGSSVSAFSITVVAAPATLPTALSNSVITANVKNNAGVAISGVTVSFSATSGSLSPASATTDGSGNAVVTYRGDGIAGVHTSVVTASITVGGFTYSDAKVISYSQTAAGFGITLTAAPASFAGAGGTTVTSILTATIATTDPTQTVSGKVVTFSLLTIGGALSSATATTDGTGKASVIFTYAAPVAPATYNAVFKASSGGAETLLTMQIGS